MCPAAAVAVMTSLRVAAAAAAGLGHSWQTAVAQRSSSQQVASGGPACLFAMVSKASLRAAGLAVGLWELPGGVPGWEREACSGPAQGKNSGPMHCASTSSPGASCATQRPQG